MTKPSKHEQLFSDAATSKSVGRSRIALKQLNRAIELSWKASHVPAFVHYFTKYMIEMELGNFDSALATSELLCTLYPLNPRTYHAKTMACIKSHMYEEAYIATFVGLAYFTNSAPLLCDLQYVKEKAASERSTVFGTADELNPECIFLKSQHFQNPRNEAIQCSFLKDCFATPIGLHTIASVDELLCGISLELRRCILSFSLSKVGDRIPDEISDLEKLTVPRVVNLVAIQESCMSNIIRFYEGKEYTRELRLIFRQSVLLLEKVHDTKNCAIIFDIDDTVLMGYEKMKSSRFKVIPQYDPQYVHFGKPPANPLVLYFFNYVSSRNFKVIFLSSRIETSYQGTKACLENAGYDIANTEILLRPVEQIYQTVSIFKLNARKKIAIDRGLNIIACIGDQYSDMSGGYTGQMIKLPNYLYQVE